MVLILLDSTSSTVLGYVSEPKFFVTCKFRGPACGAVCMACVGCFGASIVGVNFFERERIVQALSAVGKNLQCVASQ
jgi:hypothetical protein